MSDDPAPTLTSTIRTDDGLSLTYDVWEPAGSPVGVPVVLHHGFAASAAANWVTPGIVGALLRDSRRVIAVDARGHGRSDKPHDPAAYGHRRMSLDVSTLFDHLGHEKVDLVGYSMGGFVTAITAARAEPRLRSAVIGGIGRQAIVGEHIPRDAIADGLEVDDADTVSDPSARQFRRFADMTGSDRFALAAIMRSPFQLLEHLDHIAVPTLVLVGENDDLAADAETLAAAIPGALLRITPGTHMSAVAEPAYAAGIVDFLRTVDGRVG